MKMLINQSDIRSFNEDGVVILRGVFSEWIETLIKGAERNIENPSERALTHHHEKYKGQIFEALMRMELLFLEVFLVNGLKL